MDVLDWFVVKREDLEFIVFELHGYEIHWDKGGGVGRLYGPDYRFVMDSDKVRVGDLRGFCHLVLRVIRESE